MAAGKVPFDESAIDNDPRPKKKPKQQTSPVKKPASKKPSVAPTEEDTDSSTLFQMEHTCIFCGERDEGFDEEGLDLHYWKSCPMLKRCTFCKQVVEIAGLSEHYVTECEAKDNFRKCQRCTEAINAGEFEQHDAEKSCAPAEENKSHCPLCHLNFPLGEEEWRNHLMGKDGCKANPRRLQSLNRQQTGGSKASKSKTGKTGSQATLKSNAERTKQMRIKTGVLKRTAKDKLSYEEELANNELILKDMYDEVKSEAEIKKQQELVEESKKMVADTDRRMKKAYRDLEDTIEQENMATADKSILETKEYRDAIESLSEVKNQMDGKDI